MTCFSCANFSSKYLNPATLCFINKFNFPHNLYIRGISGNAIGKNLSGLFPKVNGNSKRYFPKARLLIFSWHASFIPWKK